MGRPHGTGHGVRRGYALRRSRAPLLRVRVPSLSPVGWMQQADKLVAILADFVLSFDPTNTDIRWYQTVALYQTGSLDQAAAAIAKLQADMLGVPVIPAPSVASTLNACGKVLNTS